MGAKNTGLASADPHKRRPSKERGESGDRDSEDCWREREPGSSRVTGSVSVQPIRCVDTTMLSNHLCWARGDPVENPGRSGLGADPFHIAEIVVAGAFHRARRVGTTHGIELEAAALVAP